MLHGSRINATGPAGETAQLSNVQGGYGVSQGTKPDSMYTRPLVAVSIPKVLFYHLCAPRR